MQAASFYVFDLDRHVPGDYLLRSIDRFVHLSGIRVRLRPFYSAIGRPSIDLELMIRMLLVGSVMGILSKTGGHVSLDLRLRAAYLHQAARRVG